MCASGSSLVEGKIMQQMKLGQLLILASSSNIFKLENALENNHHGYHKEASSNQMDVIASRRVLLWSMCEEWVATVKHAIPI